MATPTKKYKNETDLPLADAIRHQARDFLLTDVSQESQTSRLFESYQSDPVGFVEKELDYFITEEQKEIAKSVLEYPITICESGNAIGKSLPLRTLVITPDGWRMIGDLKVGDYVAGKSGKFIRVLGVFPQGMQPTYKMTFNDGFSIQCSEDHLWTSISSHDKNRGKSWKTYTTLELRRILSQVMSIPVVEAVEFDEKKFQLKPYLMGALLGDGCFRFSNVSFSTADDEILNEIEYNLPPGHEVSYRNHFGCNIVSSTRDVAHPINEVLNALRYYGLAEKYSYEKEIPEEYMLGSTSQRKELLAGLMDTDGFCNSHGSCMFYSSSKVLALQVAELVQSLGGIAKVHDKQTSFTHKGIKKEGRKSYCVIIHLEFCPFKLSRKAERFKPQSNFHKKINRIIRSIEPIGKFESVCIMVDAKDGLFVTEHYVVTHNSFIAAFIAAWFYKVFPESQVYTTAAPPVENLQKILWGEIGKLIYKSPALFQGDKISLASLLVSRSPASFITGVAIPTSGSPTEREARFSGKHSPYILFIVDEGDAVPPEVYKGIEACMSGGFARLLILFNPRHESGAPYQMKKSGAAHVIQMSALTHPNVMTGMDVIPGAVTQAITVKRINEWTRLPRPDEVENYLKIPDSPEFFTVPDSLVGCSAKGSNGLLCQPLKAGFRIITNPAFSYMVLGQYPSISEDQLIAKEWILRAEARYETLAKLNGDKRPPKIQRSGLDVADMGNDLNVMTDRHFGIVFSPTIWSGVDPTETAKIAAETAREKNIQEIFVDSTGVGAGVPAGIRTHFITAYRIMVGARADESCEEGRFDRIRDQGFWALREFLRSDPSAALAPDEERDEELLALTYHKDPRFGYIKVADSDTLRSKLRRSADRANSLMLTFCPIPEDDNAPHMKTFNYIEDKKDGSRSANSGKRLY